MSTPPSGALLTVLGAGTLVPDGSHGSAAHHVAAGEASVLVDCGSGALHALARHGVAWRALSHVAVTHFHPDHVSDLVALLASLSYDPVSPRTEPLTLVGPAGLRRFLAAMADTFGGWVVAPGFPLEVVELEGGDGYEDGAGGLGLRALGTPHADPSLAYVLTGPWGTVAYTGDTGPSQEVARFLAGADVLIAECSHPDERAVDSHLTPSTLAEMAGIAAPELLVVTHVYPTHGPADAVARIAERYPGRTVAASDGLRVSLAGGRVTVDLPGRDR